MTVLLYQVPHDIGNSSVLFEDPQSSAACPSQESSINIKMSTEHWWNDTDRGNPKYSEENLTHCHFVHHK
jgi:hypothetical protein